MMEPEVIILDDDASDDVQIVGFSVCRSASFSHDSNRGLICDFTCDFSPPSPTKQAHKSTWADEQNSFGR